MTITPDFAHPVRLRVLTARPALPLVYEDHQPGYQNPHWMQIEHANDIWMPFEQVFTGTPEPAPTAEATGSTGRAIQHAGRWALRHPSHPAPKAIAARIPYVHYLAAGPDVLHHDPCHGTIQVPGIADDLMVLGDTAGRDIDTPTTFGGLIAVTYDMADEHLYGDRPRVTVLHWAVPEETFDTPDDVSPGEDDHAPGKEVVLDFTPVSLQLYTAAMMYHATGEGMQIKVLVTMAQSESDARQRFLDHFYPAGRTPRRGTDAACRCTPACTCITDCP